MEEVQFSPWLSKRQGFMYVENVRVKTLQEELEQELPGCSSPVFVYSKTQILANVSAYRQPLQNSGLPYMLGFSVKANYNPHILRLIYGTSGSGDSDAASGQKDITDVKKQASENTPTTNCSAVVAVSGNEARLAVERCAVAPHHVVVNGNGKHVWELEYAVRTGCMLNIDSVFDLRRLESVTRRLETSARVLLRLNPDIDVAVHPFLATGLAKSKFGIDDAQLNDVIEMLRGHDTLRLIGLHCHLGSTIDNVNVFSECLDVMLAKAEQIKQQGFTDLHLINLGGGLGINYRLHEHRTYPCKTVPVDDRRVSELLENTRQTFQQDLSGCDEICRLITDAVSNPEVPRVRRLAELLVDKTDLLRQAKALIPQLNQQIAMPTPADLVQCVRERLVASGYTLIVEPGRSIIANAGVLLTKTLGCKINANKRYVVVDAAMTEVIRPALYSAYHHVELTEPPHHQVSTTYVCDVVGPVCECGDFIAKDRLLPEPHEGCGLAVFDTGAYCSSMASNYNMRPRPAEVLVDGNKWRLIRRPETFEDMLNTFNV